jgi:uncharacterized protein YecE (DUF72 family)
LAHFIKLLPGEYDYAFEFRHISWYEAPIIELLQENDIALCLSDHHQAPAPWLLTAQHVYVRGHGPTGRYKGRYPAITLKSWAQKIRSCRKIGKTVYVFFDNDQKSAAPNDALRLNSLI